MGNKRFAFYYGWLIVAAVFVIMLIGSGVQNSLGVFILPLHASFGWDISTIALAPSIALISYAVSQPIVGKLTDRWGVRAVILLGVLLMGTGEALLSTLTSTWQLYAYFGLLVGFGAGATSLPLIVLVTNWFRKRRGLAVSIANSAIGAGFPTITMLALITIYLFDWKYASLAIGAIAVGVTIPLTLLVLKDKPPEPISASQASSVTRADPEDRATSLATMLRDRSFWLIALPYGVCGFSVSLVSVHLVPLAVDDDIPQLTAGGALGVLGLFMTIGLLFAGVFADRMSRKDILTLSYGIRSLAFIMILGTASVATVYAFAAIFGFVELATIPATTLLCRQLYGAKSMGLAYGLLMFSHQMGGALSSYLGGVVVDATGSYQPIIAVSIALTLAAAAASTRIRERSSLLSLLKRPLTVSLPPAVPGVRVVRGDLTIPTAREQCPTSSRPYSDSGGYCTVK